MNTKPTSRQIGRAFGYSDDDLSTPGHDALVLWVRKHMFDLLTQYVVPPLSTLHDGLAARVAAMEAERIQRTTEDRLRPGNAYFPQNTRPIPPAVSLRPLRKDECWFVWYKPIIEHRVKGGWIDVYTSGHALADITGSYDYRQVPWRFAVEVKTVIRSFGELLRQLRVYRDFVGRDKHCHVCVVSPDKVFADAIRDQGFLFHEAQIPPVTLDQAADVKP